MRRKRLFTALVMGMALGTALVGCSHKESKYDAETAASAPAAGYDRDENMEEDSGAFPSDRGLSAKANPSMDNPNDSIMEKIIRRVNMEVETREFDVLIQALDDEILRLGGYVESSELRGKRYHNIDSMRRADIVARIPKDKLDEFIGTVYDSSNVVNKTETTENVTLEYYDIESRKKSLEIEQERLFALLEKTDNLEDIITLESRLSSVRYELQNYGTQLRTYDNLVDYSTVTIAVYEVERMSPEDAKTVMARIKNGFSNTLYNIGEGTKNFFVWFVVNLPYILIWAAIISGVALILRRYYKRNMKKLPEPPMKQKENDTIEK